LADEQFAQDEPGFDGFSEPDIISNEEVNAGHSEGETERFKLVGFDLNSSAVGGLEKFGIGRSDTVPTQGVKVGREEVGVIKAPSGEPLPVGPGEGAGIDFEVPQDFELFALGVVFEARQAGEGAISRIGGRGFEVFDEILSRADPNDISAFWIHRHLMAKGRGQARPAFRQSFALQHLLLFAYQIRTGATINKPRNRVEGA
jgi:hypothetical protein